MTVAQLPGSVLPYIYPSRYCESDRLHRLAVKEFGHLPQGYTRVQAISNWVTQRVAFRSNTSNGNTTALDTLVDEVGVCRDFAHLAITLCRCMNIPARYCTGYIGDIDFPPVDEMDFSAWMEVYLGGQWRTLDARHNTPRIGRVMMAMGRDATDVAIITNFGPATLAGFKVIAEELV
eukprot:gene17154-35500_t